ncbi:MAG: hypothetical protein D6815_08180 [Candidatus Dadabacteria bacterium]|nr:MAG: hypothetical protein D6815_08180 [Candidatus Dadabacteria bacterium]
MRSSHHNTWVLIFFVPLFDSTTGAGGTVFSAKGKAVISDTVRFDAPVKRKVAACDPSLELPAPGSGHNPTLAGTELHSSNSRTGELAT